MKMLNNKSKIGILTTAVHVLWLVFNLFKIEQKYIRSSYVLSKRIENTSFYN